MTYLGTEPKKKKRLYGYAQAFLMAQREKDTPAEQEMQVPSWVGRLPGGGSGNPLSNYSCLENTMDSCVAGAW